MEAYTTVEAYTAFRNIQIVWNEVSGISDKLDAEMQKVIDSLWALLSPDKKIMLYMGRMEADPTEVKELLHEVSSDTSSGNVEAAKKGLARLTKLIGQNSAYGIDLSWELHWGLSARERQA